MLLLGRALRFVLLVLRFDRLARFFPVGVGPAGELGEGRAVGEPAAAVDRDGLAGEPLAAVGHEERGEVLQLFHFSRAAHRVDRRGVPLRIAAGREALACAFGRKDPRRNGIQAYSITSPFDRERLGHDVHARLGHRRRHDEGRAGPHPGDDDRDHRALVAARDPALADGVRYVERAVENGVGDGVESARRKVLGAGYEVAGGVVHQAGVRPALVPDRLDHRIHGRGVADVAGEGLDRAAVLRRELRGGFVEHGFSSAADSEIGAEPEVLRRDLAPEAGAAAGDEDALAFQQTVAKHSLLLSARSRSRYTVSTILPICRLDSISSCAPAASASGKVLWTTALILPRSMSGQIFSRRFFAIAPLNSTGRGRSAEPETVRRRRRMSLRKSVAFAPPRNAMMTMRPSSARAFSSRSTYSPPTMSRMTSTPLPPVTSFATATKSSVL